MLTQFPTTDFVGSAADGRTALTELDAMARQDALPDVVLMDIVMPDMDGIEVATRIRHAHPTVRIVVLTNYGDVERVHHAMLAGVSGYVLKGSDIDDVATAITAAHRGIVHLDETVARRLMNLVPGGSTTTPKLTARERDVLILIARGESSPRSPKNSRSAIAPCRPTPPTCSQSSTSHPEPKPPSGPYEKASSIQEN